jgi:transposase
MPRLRRFFPPEYKAEVVELIRSTGKTVGQVARELDLTETAVRQWVRQADLDAGRRTDGLTTAEGEELRRLRRENRELREEREILRKAAVLRLNVRMRLVRWGSLVSLLPRSVAGGLSGDVRPHWSSPCSVELRCWIPHAG